MKADKPREDGSMTFGGWSREGHLNAAIYPPGIVCLAMDGCPINPQCWSVVTWYPGKPTIMRCFPTSADAQEFVKETIS